MEQLIRLQNIDTKLKDLNDLLGDLPSKVEDLNNQEESTKDSITSKKSRSKELDVEINKTELDVSALIGKIDKLKDQLFLVTNNKQYDALMTEIDHLKEKRTGSENKLIELMEEKESIIELIGSMESELQSLSETLTVRRKKLELVIEESAEEKNSLQKQRDQNVKDIDQNTLNVYSRVIEHRGGLAVVPLQGSACGGCGAHIPPQTVSEVRAKSAVHTCGVCGRFLYHNKV
ncbi:MAG: zinc ribbon domain-containing protein [Candidatus Neomarinimicrobiota bacterium]